MKTPESQPVTLQYFCCAYRRANVLLSSSASPCPRCSSLAQLDTRGHRQLLELAFQFPPVPNAGLRDHPQMSLPDGSGASLAMQGRECRARHQTRCAATEMALACSFPQLHTTNEGATGNTNYLSTYLMVLLIQATWWTLSHC